MEKSENGMLIDKGVLKELPMSNESYRELLD